LFSYKYKKRLEMAILATGKNFSDPKEHKNRENLSHHACAYIIGHVTNWESLKPFLTRFLAALAELERSDCENIMKTCMMPVTSPNPATKRIMPFHVDRS